MLVHARGMDDSIGNNRSISMDETKRISQLVTCCTGLMKYPPHLQQYHNICEFAFLGFESMNHTRTYDAITVLLYDNLGSGNIHHGH